jgi:hypothetical protein
MRAENKSSSFSTAKKRLMEHQNGRNQVGLRLQLEAELDKLALLMQEVREQSARVQAAADAIGDKMALDTTAGSAAANIEEDSRSAKRLSIVGESSL